MGWRWAWIGAGSYLDFNGSHSGEEVLAGALWQGIVSYRLPGVVLAVRPSTLRDWKYLQKFDPSGHPSAGVSDPSGHVAESFGGWRLGKGSLKPLIVQTRSLAQSNIHLSILAGKIERNVIAVNAA